MSETLTSRALKVLHEWVQSESLRKHCYAKSARSFAEGITPLRSSGFGAQDSHW